jgi:two-component system, OmpR family, phosphate regulon response regulator PhoB
MRWDDFARVGSPTIFGPTARGLSLGQSTFPPALCIALTRAGVHVDATADLRELEKMVRERKPDFLICAAPALGPDPEAAIEGLLQTRPKGNCPAILLSEERQVSESAHGETRFSEVLGTGQDALGYFLMIRATLRRKRPHVMTEVLQFGKLTLDQEKFVVSFEDRQAPLKMLEFCVLGAMLDAPRMVWSKVFLNRVVFGPVDVKPGRQFDTYMSLARRHIRDRIGVDPIVAEHGLGYALAPSVLGVPGIAGH